mmetsp:Transcript_57770/g.161156  ORF Transcript_57770/g.161156 Transcript_57770/m.161156 type:complete len:279 (-) Transcript_57770:462-1298(-)
MAGVRFVRRGRGRPRSDREAETDTASEFVARRQRRRGERCLHGPRAARVGRRFLRGHAAVRGRDHPRRLRLRRRSRSWDAWCHGGRCQHRHGSLRAADAHEERLSASRSQGAQLRRSVARNDPCAGLERLWLVEEGVREGASQQHLRRRRVHRRAVAASFDLVPQLGNETVHWYAPFPVPHPVGLGDHRPPFLDLDRDVDGQGDAPHGGRFGGGRDVSVRRRGALLAASDGAIAEAYGHGENLRQQHVLASLHRRCAAGGGRRRRGRSVTGRDWHPRE